MPHDATVPTADATKTLNPRVGGVGFRVWTIGFGDTAEPCGHKRPTLGLAKLLQGFGILEPGSGSFSDSVWIRLPASYLTVFAFSEATENSGHGTSIFHYP